MTDDKRGDWTPSANPWAIALVVTSAAFMEILDITIVNVSIRHIAGGMSVSYDNATWTMTAYLVANGIVLTISGWLAKVFGRKRYFIICLGMFTVSSVLCGLSTNLAELVVMRAVQGFFGGGLQPTQQAILLDSFKPADRGKAFGLTAVATVVAPAIGPTLGGWITDNYSWPWIFFINLPVGIAAIFAVIHLIEDPPWAKAQALHGIDITGISLITLGLGCLQVTLDRGEDEDWFGSPTIVITAVLAVIGLLGAVAWLLYARKPVINIRVMKDRNFAMASILMAAMAALLYGSAVLLPELAQEVLGYTATLAGLILSPGALLLVGLIPLVVFLQKIVPVKYLILTGFLILGGSMIYCDRLTPDISFGELVFMRSLQSAGLAFLFAPLTTIAFVNISREDSGDASALFTMFRNVAGSIGISITTSQIIERTQIRSAHLVSHLSPLDQGYSIALQQLQRTFGASATGHLYQVFLNQASILAYADLFMYAGIGALCVAPIALLLSNVKGGGQPNAAH
jgi:DHA2 family multidrug resistance protein